MTGARLRKIPVVQEASMVTGTADIIIKVRVKGIGGLNAFVTNKPRNIGGTEKSHTMVILEES